MINYKEKVNPTKALGYLSFFKLKNNARRILTDSGSIQKEAYILGTMHHTARQYRVGVWNTGGGIKEELLKWHRNLDLMVNRGTYLACDVSRKIARAISKGA
jgi:hypothetical protein